MSHSAPIATARAGNTILIASSGHSGSSPDLRGEILQLLGDSRCPSCLVRWPNGSVSVVPLAVTTPA